MLLCRQVRFLRYGLLKDIAMGSLFDLHLCKFDKVKSQGNNRLLRLRET